MANNQIQQMEQELERHKQERLIIFKTITATLDTGKLDFSKWNLSQDEKLLVLRDEVTNLRQILDCKDSIIRHISAKVIGDPRLPDNHQQADDNQVSICRECMKLFDLQDKIKEQHCETLQPVELQNIPQCSTAFPYRLQDKLAVETNDASTETNEPQIIVTKPTEAEKEESTPICSCSSKEKAEKYKRRNNELQEYIDKLNSKVNQQKRELNEMNRQLSTLQNSKDLTRHTTESSTIWRKCNTDDLNTKVKRLATKLENQKNELTRHQCVMIKLKKALRVTHGFDDYQRARLTANNMTIEDMVDEFIQNQNNSSCILKRCWDNLRLLLKKLADAEREVTKCLKSDCGLTVKAYRSLTEPLWELVEDMEVNIFKTLFDVGVKIKRRHIRMESSASAKRVKLEKK